MDLHRFKEITDGHIVIMGRKTMEALPGQNPLSNRINIIITRLKDFKKEGFVVNESSVHRQGYIYYRYLDYERVNW